MNSLKSIFTFFFLSSAIVLSIASFNYSIDPQCFRCEEVIPSKVTLNYYYQMAQKILQNRDTEIIILGSSRGQTTPEAWVQNKTGLKTLNLSSSGAELAIKSVYLNMAAENLKLKRVIWMADYFELVSENVDIKMKNTPALRKYLPPGISEDSNVSIIDQLQGLIDHNTTEASLALGRQSQNTPIPTNSSSINYENCKDPLFKSHQSQESLLKEVDLIYQNYVSGALRPQQSLTTRATFKSIIHDLSDLGVLVDIIIPPYHPFFTERLRLEHPIILERHHEWINTLESMKKDGIRIVNSFDGIPGDDGSPRFWNDGSHFTCYASMVILEEVLALATSSPK